MARRLVESGVRFVVVHYGPGQPWDDHKEIEKNLRERCPNMDKASAALIRDLKRRGLLDETLVVCGGEFGRTPVSRERRRPRSQSLRLLDAGSKAFPRLRAPVQSRGDDALEAGGAVSLRRSRLKRSN
jgi:hypothetical protein